MKSQTTVLFSLLLGNTSIPNLVPSNNYRLFRSQFSSVGWQFGLDSAGCLLCWAVSCVGSIADRLGGSASERVGWGQRLLGPMSAIVIQQPSLYLFTMIISRFQVLVSRSSKTSWGLPSGLIRCHFPIAYWLSKASQWVGK